MSEQKYQRFSDRFFELSALFAEPGWYFKLRGGEIKGPYSSRENAQNELYALFSISNRYPEQEMIEVYSGNSRTTE